MKKADDEAVEWVILLREDPADDDMRARFDAWLSASPLNSSAWAAAAHAYDRAGDVRPVFSRPVRSAEVTPILPAGTAGYARSRRPPYRNSLHTVQRRLPRRRILMAAVTAALLLIAVGPSIALRAQADHLTGMAEIKSLKLDDGSSASLAPASAIAVTYTSNRREVRLLKGEAWFDVRHDPSRPFYVNAQGITTTVLGTSFTVRLYGDGATTQVARGSVRVAYGNAAPPVSEQLRPGESLRVTFAGNIQRGKRPIGQIAAWRNGQIVVRNRPATEVIDALRPWYAGMIVVRGNSFSSLRVTGVYNAADPVEALKGLTQAYGGSVSTITPWIIVISPQ